MQRWESIKKGFLLKAPDGYYIWGILSNGNPKNPVIYKTTCVWEAKYWRTLKGATEAAARISAAAAISLFFIFCLIRNGENDSPVRRLAGIDALAFLFADDCVHRDASDRGFGLILDLLLGLRGAVPVA